MANPVNPTAAVGVNPLSDSVPQSVSTKSSAIGRTVALVDAMVQTQSEDHECGELSAEKGSYFQRLRSYLPNFSKLNFLPRIREKLFGSADAADQPSFKPVVVTVYHRPSLCERAVSVVKKTVTLIVAPARLLVWKPLKFFCTQVCTVKTYLFNHQQYAAGKKADLDAQLAESTEQARHMSARCINAKAKMKVVEESVEAHAKARMPYVKALDELKPILEQRRKMLEENQPDPNELEKFRALGVIPGDKNEAFVQAMTDYNSAAAEYKAAKAEYDAVVAQETEAGEEPPVLPASLSSQPVAPHFRCENEDLCRAYQATSDKPLLRAQAELTEHLETLQVRLRERSSRHADILMITSDSAKDAIKEEISALKAAVRHDEAALKHGTVPRDCREARKRIEDNNSLIDLKKLLVDIYTAEQELKILGHSLASVQEVRETDHKEWQEGVIDPVTGEVIQGGRDRLSLDLINVDKANLKVDSNGNVTHLAYVIGRPLINPVHPEHESREARNNGYVWRRAGVNNRPVARYEAAFGLDSRGVRVVTGSYPAEVEREHWFVRDEPVVHVKGFDKRHLAVDILSTDV